MIKYSRILGISEDSFLKMRGHRNSLAAIPARWTQTKLYSLGRESSLSSSIQKKCLVSSKGYREVPKKYWHFLVVLCYSVIFYSIVICVTTWQWRNSQENGLQEGQPKLSCPVAGVHLRLYVHKYSGKHFTVCVKNNFCIVLFLHSCVFCCWIFC